MKYNQRTLYPIPAVRAIIQNSKGQILVLKRDNTESGQGSWCLPGGKVDYGQTVEEALVVEIHEELSLELVAAQFYFFQNSLPVEKGEAHYINFYFYCRAQGELKLNKESSEFAWIGVADIQHYDIVFKNDEALIRHFNERA